MSIGGGEVRKINMVLFGNGSWEICTARYYACKIPPASLSFYRWGFQETVFADKYLHVVWADSNYSLLCQTLQGESECWGAWESCRVVEDDGRKMLGSLTNGFVWLDCRAFGSSKKKMWQTMLWVWMWGLLHPRWRRLLSRRMLRQRIRRTIWGLLRWCLRHYRRSNQRMDIQALFYAFHFPMQKIG